MSNSSNWSRRTTRFGAGIRILFGNDIERAVQHRSLVIAPFDSKSVQPTSYDFAVKQCVSDSGEFQDFETLKLDGGQSTLFLSNEYFEFPRDMIAHIWLRSSFARKLRMSSALGRIEAGWRGHLVVEIINNNHSTDPVEFRSGDRLATLEIYGLDKASPLSYSGQYQDYAVEMK